MEKMSDADAFDLSRKVVGTWPKYPNNYCFTKTLTEILLYQETNEMNIAILRLPLLISSLRDPKIGWFDVPQASSSLVSLYATGILRNARFDPNYDFNHIPLDMVANALIVAGWQVASLESSSSSVNNNNLENRRRIYKIFNINTVRDAPINISRVSHIAAHLGNKYPSIKQIRPPKSGFTARPSEFYYRIYTFFTYDVFNYIIDRFTEIVGQKPM